MAIKRQETRGRSGLRAAATTTNSRGCFSARHSENTPQSSTTKGLTLAIDSGVALALVTAYLYCASTARFGGYLSTLMLDGDVLDRNFHQVLYDGFLESFTHLVAVISCGAGVTFLFAMFGTKRMAAWTSKMRAGHSPSDWHFAVLAAKLAFALMIFITMIFVLAGFEKDGKSLALQRLETIQTRALNEGGYMEVKIGDRDMRLAFLACGARNCAGLDPASGRVHYFPQNGHSFRHPSFLLTPAVPPTAPSSGAGRSTP